MYQEGRNWCEAPLRPCVVFMCKSIVSRIPHWVCWINCFALLVKSLQFLVISWNNDPFRVQTFESQKADIWVPDISVPISKYCIQIAEQSQSQFILKWAGFQRLGAEASAGVIADMLWKSQRSTYYGCLYGTNLI